MTALINTKPHTIILPIATLLLAAGCRTGQPAVVLSPHYHRPSPYVMPAERPQPKLTPVAVAPPVAAEPPQPVVMEPLPLTAPPLVLEAPVVEVVPEPIQPLPTLEPLLPIKEVQASKPAAPAPRFDSTTRVWTVAKGDTLWYIGRQHKVSPRQIAAANNIQVNSLLRVDQELRIPHPGEIVAAEAARETAEPKAVATPTVPAEAADYVVEKGDSLWRIARKHGVRVADLEAWNQLKGQLLHPGQILRVKDQKTVVVDGREEVLVKVSHAKQATIPRFAQNDANPVDTRDPASTPPGSTTEPAQAGSTRMLPHYVAAGDSLRSIALLYDASPEEILARNPKISDKGPLKPGTRLEIPLPNGRY